VTYFRYSQRFNEWANSQPDKYLEATAVVILSIFVLLPICILEMIFGISHILFPEEEEKSSEKPLEDFSVERFDEPMKEVRKRLELKRSRNENSDQV
jgi:hypothetical protein